MSFLLLLRHSLVPGSAVTTASPVAPVGLPNANEFQSTSTTLFNSPNWFVSTYWLFGSVTHWPSTTRRYR
jgi:hypothetical protein